MRPIMKESSVPNVQEAELNTKRYHSEIVFEHVRQSIEIPETNEPEGYFYSARKYFSGWTKRLSDWKLTVFSSTNTIGNYVLDISGYNKLFHDVQREMDREDMFLFNTDNYFNITKAQIMRLDNELILALHCISGAYLDDSDSSYNEFMHNLDTKLTQLSTQIQLIITLNSSLTGTLFGMKNIKSTYLKSIKACVEAVELYEKRALINKIILQVDENIEKVKYGTEFIEKYYILGREIKNLLGVLILYENNIKELKLPLFKERQYIESVFERCERKMQIALTEKEFPLGVLSSKNTQKLRVIRTETMICILRKHLFIGVTSRSDFEKCIEKHRDAFWIALSIGEIIHINSSWLNRRSVSK